MSAELKQSRRKYLAPSILSADLLHLADQLKIVEENGADYIHFDVMDGQYVPNLTFGPIILRAVQKACDLPLDVHLMITEPDRYIKDFAESGAAVITVHPEACLHLDRTLNSIKEQGCLSGVALNPATPLNLIENVIEMLDLLLIMSVNPGFGGQKFIPYTLNKIRRARQLLDERNANCLLEVDGGINAQSIPDVSQAGADVFVAGNGIFNQPSIADACRTLKHLADSVVKEA